MSEKYVFQKNDVNDSPTQIEHGKLVAFNDTKLPAAAKQAAGENLSLPDLKLDCKEFPAVAESIFERLDYRGNGVIEKSALLHELQYPSRDDTAKTTQAIKAMYDNFQFLSDLSDSSEAPLHHHYGISKIGLAKVENLLNGKLDPDKEILSTVNRFSYARNASLTGMGITGITGVAAGCNAMAAAEYFGAGTIVAEVAGAAGLLTGVGLGALAIGATGYGIGYLLDKHHKNVAQKSEIASFMKEFS